MYGCVIITLGGRREGVGAKWNNLHLESDYEIMRQSLICGWLVEYGGGSFQLDIYYAWIYRYAYWKSGFSNALPTDFGQTGISMYSAPHTNSRIFRVPVFLLYKIVIACYFTKKKYVLA